MDRLTAKGGRIKFYESVYCKHSNADMPDIRKQINDGILVHKIEGYQGGSLYVEDLEEIYNKLAHYEDYDLEPEEIGTVIKSQIATIKHNVELSTEVEALKAEVERMTKMLNFDCDEVNRQIKRAKTAEQQIAVLELALKSAIDTLVHGTLNCCGGKSKTESEYQVCIETATGGECKKCHEQYYLQQATAEIAAEGEESDE